ncbi:MAG: ABC transporter ATP-binding protein [Polyangiaceae bacterium]|nr:ABC transporter ATP-binding protein [Polyangiaceae bacterium]
MSEGTQLRVENVSLSDRLQNIELSFSPGSIQIVIGPNGAGKSTLLRMLAGIEEPSQGKIYLGKKCLTKLSSLEKAAYLSWLPQRPYLQKDLLPIDIVSAARYRIKERTRIAQKKAVAYLESTGCSHLAQKNIGSLSGGELQRVQIAALLAQEAPILLVDEPGNHLDPLGQKQTYELLAKAVQQGSKTLILISHDLRLAPLLGIPDETAENTSTSLGKPSCPKEVNVIGLKNARLEFCERIDAPQLPQQLENLYQLPYSSLKSSSPLAPQFMLTEQSTASASPEVIGERKGEG